MEGREKCGWVSESLTPKHSELLISFLHEAFEVLILRAPATGEQ